MGVLNATLLCVCVCVSDNDLCTHKWARANPLTLARVTKRPCYQCEQCIVLQPVIYFILCLGKAAKFAIFFSSKLIAGCATLETNGFAFATRGRISR